MLGASGLKDNGAAAARKDKQALLRDRWPTFEQEGQRA